MKPPLRTKSVGDEGLGGGVRLAGGTCAWGGMRLAEWVREALLSAPMASGPDSGEVALGEILALRSLLLNLHFRAAKGEPGAEMETEQGDQIWHKFPDVLDRSGWDGVE